MARHEDVDSRTITTTELALPFTAKKVKKGELFSMEPQ